jgi:redox-sensing transcriptional repressor
VALQSGKRKISESTIHRLSFYYRVLSILEKENYETVSSRELARREKLTPAKVRKDLSFFGSLVGYKEFQRQNFNIKVIFDNDQRKIGSNHKGIIVSDIGNLAKDLKDNNIKIVIIAVPATVAQYTVDHVVQAGIKGILNFAPVNLKVPDDVFLRNENISMELEYLSFALVNLIDSHNDGKSGA